MLIAIALACRPKLLIADEPTTALDVTIQAQILDLLDRLRQEHHMALIIITHDMGMVADSGRHRGHVRGADRGAGTALDLFENQATRTRGRSWGRCRSSRGSGIREAG